MTQVWPLFMATSNRVPVLAELAGPPFTLWIACTVPIRGVNAV